jgi:hypothetical protein
MAQMARAMTQFQMQGNPMRSPVSGNTGFAQRKCSCGGLPGISGECADCRENRLQRKALDSIHVNGESGVFRRNFISLGDLRRGHSFSGLQIYSQNHSSRKFLINGPDEGSKPQPNSPAPSKKDPAPPARVASNCPSDIQVAAISPANDVDFGKDGFLSGWGGIAIMEVSDPTGKTWDGTAIHENLKNIKNTCGNRGKKICSNESGERGGTAGSTFKVGEESNFLGKAKLPAAKNRFYDLHVFSTKEASLLHEIKKGSCEVQCSQSYDCGGKRFGPDFVISYAMTRDVVKAGARNIDVTRVEMKKVPAAKQGAPSNAKP